VLQIGLEIGEASALVGNLFPVIVTDSLPAYLNPVGDSVHKTAQHTIWNTSDTKMFFCVTTNAIELGILAFEARNHGKLAQDQRQTSSGLLGRDDFPIQSPEEPEFGLGYLTPYGYCKSLTFENLTA
jgi:hypothetical protein